jgi:hypothetical protein
MKKYLLIGFSCIVFLTMDSCETQQQLDPNTVMLNKLLTSTAFKNLNIQKSELDISAPQISSTNSGKNTLLLPFINIHNKLLIGVYDENGEVNFAYSAKFDTNQKGFTENSIEKIDENFLSGKFNGQILFETSQMNTIVFGFKNSKLIDGSKSAKTEKCDSIIGEGHGSAFSCAGKNIENMSPWGQAACYWTFIACLASEVADCIYFGCPNRGGI